MKNGSVPCASDFCQHLPAFGQLEIKMYHCSRKQLILSPLLQSIVNEEEFRSSWVNVFIVDLYECLGVRASFDSEVEVLAHFFCKLSRGKRSSSPSFYQKICEPSPSPNPATFTLNPLPTLTVYHSRHIFHHRHILFCGAYFMLYLQQSILGILRPVGATQS